MVIPTISGLPGPLAEESGGEKISLILQLGNDNIQREERLVYTNNYNKVTGEINFAIRRQERDPLDA